MQRLSFSAGLVVVLCLSDTAYSQTNCTAANIKVEQFRAQNEGSITTSILGVLLNGCNVPTGPQIKVTFYDQAGTILRVEDMWPASINNIPPKSYFPFQVRLNRVEGFSWAEVRVITTKTW